MVYLLKLLEDKSFPKTLKLQGKKVFHIFSELYFSVECFDFCQNLFFQKVPKSRWNKSLAFVLLSFFRTLHFTFKQFFSQSSISGKVPFKKSFSRIIVITFVLLGALDLRIYYLFTHTRRNSQVLDVAQTVRDGFMEMYNIRKLFIYFTILHGEVPILHKRAQ